MNKLAFVFDQFVDWVVDCMFTPGVRTVESTGILTILAALLAWFVGNLKLTLVVFCFGVSLTCGLALSMWLLFWCCRYIQYRSMEKALSFDEALTERAPAPPIDLSEASVLDNDTALIAGIEACYDTVMDAIGAKSIVAGAEEMLRSDPVAN